MSHYSQTEFAEIYDVKLNIWIQLPSLNSKKNRPTLVPIEDEHYTKYVYSFGGSMGKYGKTSKTFQQTTHEVERLEFDTIIQMR